MMQPNSLSKKLAGAFVAALVMSALFVEIGYSGESSRLDFFKELFAAVTSYAMAALLVHYWYRHRDRVSSGIILISLVGSALSFLIQVGFFESQNGLSAYINQARKEASWKPISDLGIRFLFSTAITMGVSLPFVALGSWLWTMWTDRTFVNRLR